MGGIPPKGEKNLLPKYSIPMYEMNYKMLAHNSYYVYVYRGIHKISLTNYDYFLNKLLSTYRFENGAVVNSFTSIVFFESFTNLLKGKKIIFQLQYRILQQIYFQNLLNFCHFTALSLQLLESTFRDHSKKELRAE